MIVKYLRWDPCPCTTPILNGMEQRFTRRTWHHEFVSKQRHIDLNLDQHRQAACLTPWTAAPSRWRRCRDGSSGDLRFHATRPPSQGGPYGENLGARAEKLACCFPLCPVVHWRYQFLLSGVWVKVKSILILRWCGKVVYFHQIHNLEMIDFKLVS